MNLSASIVTYNSANEIRDVLNSLLACDVKGLKIYIVDNASSDNTVDIIEKEFPEINLIKSKQNIGFGAGHNLVLKRINSDYHIFINPDIFVGKGEIEKMVLYMDAHPDTVILTPRILNRDGTEQFLPKRYPKIKYILGGQFEDKSKLCYKWRSEYTLRDKDITEPTKIDYCTGCFMFCKTSALKECGGFDERFFLHFEDADLTRMMQKKGKAMFVPDIHVTHGWRRENKTSSKVRRIAIQSMLKYMWKWRNW